MSAELKPFNFKHPEYVSVWEERVKRLERLRANPGAVPALKLHYKNNIAQFISDWGCTQDPRNIEKDLPALVPFLLFPKQVEWVTWLLERWKNQEPGITEKSREMGLTWVSIATACSLCLFNPGMVIGWGSRKEEYVDSRGNPKAALEKARFFLSHLPPEFLDGWDRDKHAPFGRILFPNGSAITGESGDGIGRGDRTSIYFCDESSFWEHSELADRSLSQTTNCRIDISTPNGMANSFAQRRHSGKINVFTFHWSADPRKGPDWYAKQVHELDPVTLAAEVDINYAASATGLLIPTMWVNAAINAHGRLGITPSGIKRGALDIADSGKNLNCFSGRHGILLEYLYSWSGRDSNIYKTVVKAFSICEERGYEVFDFDQDGVGAGAVGDSEVINEARAAVKKEHIRAQPWRGSGKVWQPERCMIPKRKNAEFFANLKAQSYWALRTRFENSYKAVIEKLPVDIDNIISIDPNLEELVPLQMQLSQITYSISTVGKVVVDKNPDNIASPDRADSVNMCFSPSSRALEIWAKLAAD